MDDLDSRINALFASVAGLITRVDSLEKGCTVKHVALERRAEDFEEELTDLDRTVDLLKAELHEHGDALKAQAGVLKQLQAWVERWGMETTALGHHLERLDERQGLTAQTTGAIMNAVNGLAEEVRRGR